MMSECEPLEIDILSPKENEAEQNAHKKWTNKATLFLLIFLLVLSCFVFVLLYALEKVSNSSGGKNEGIQNVSHAMPTTKPVSCSEYCVTPECIERLHSK